MHYVAIVISFLALAFTVWKDLRQEARHIREERQRTAKDRAVEERLKQIEEAQERERKAELLRRSKASGPFLEPSRDLFANVYEHAADGQTYVYHVGGGSVLCSNQREAGADLPKGAPILLVVVNTGKEARRIRFSGDVAGLSIGQEPNLKSSEHKQFLRYPFDPELRGKTQKIVMEFETPDGYDLVHTYETRHGFFELRRVDPA